jgi:ribonuclease PH
MTDRRGGRRADQLRPLSITRHYARHAEGSALIECGETRVGLGRGRRAAIPQG